MEIYNHLHHTGIKHRNIHHLNFKTMLVPHNQTRRPVALNVAFKSIPFITILLFASCLTSFAQDKGKKMIYKVDTVEFIPGNYKLAKKTSVVEFLRHVKDMKIARNGGITFQGQKIAFISINEERHDGTKTKELQKLTIGDIDKIRVVDDYGDLASNCCFKDIDPKKVLELITKNYRPNNINGYVNNADDKSAMPGVQVQVEGSTTSEYTDLNGHYHINIPTGKNRLIFSFVGYKSDTLKIGKTNRADIYLTKNVDVLAANQNSKMLGGVTINGVSSIVYKTDTVEYRASDYKVRANSTPAELLKNMEGFTVGTDGSVTHQGQAVTKARINGKDYSGGNLAQAIQSLPADIFQKIQVVDDYGDQAARTGVKDGDPNKVLNITIKGYTPPAVATTGTVGGKLEEKAIGYSSTHSLAEAPASTVINGLAGKVAGLKVTTSGEVQPVGYGNQAPRAVAANESYQRITENQFLDPKATPLSTFAVDVDAASYSNVRRFINEGQLPPKNAVRIEEMINYFHYNLPEPENGNPVAIQTELSTAPWNTQHQLVRIGLKAKDVEKGKLPPSNLVFLLDVSGSMADANKLSLVKPAMKMLVDQLRPEDHVAIVVYAGEAGIKLESTPGNEKDKIKDAIDKLYASGSTAGGAGIIMAYDIAKKNFIKGGNNRIILATDGDFNVGASSDKDMEQLIEEERGSGVSISILGFGMGNLKDSKMERMADKGHGNYAYIDNITEATKSMVSEFGGTLFTVAKDVKLQVEFNPAKVQAYRLLGYEDRLMAKEDFNNDAKVAGDMGVNHTVTALYEIIPVGVKDSFTASVDPLKYQKPEETKSANTSSEVMTVKFRYKDPESDVSKLESVIVNDKLISADKTSEDFRFAAAVAEYGLLLRDSQFKQNAGFDQLISMAKSAKGKDDDGYRAEFIRLAESTKHLMKAPELVMEK